MKQETKRLSSIVIAGLLLAVAVIVYFDLIVPAYGSLQALKGQQESEATLYANEQQIATQAKSVLATYQNDASSSAAVALALPVNEDLSGALAQVAGIAANAGVNVGQVGVTVQAVQAASNNGTVGALNAPVSVVKPVGTVSLQISGSGSYEGIKAFLQGLETNIRIFDVAAISIEPTNVIGGKGSAASQDLFSYTITAETYYQSP